MNRILKQWRSWILLLLLAGPIAVYVGLGTLWLWQHGAWWLLAATLCWILCGVLFSVLAARWTKDANPIMPPLDWDAPNTFSPRDRAAWKIVEEEAETGDALAMEALLGVDLYIETGRKLFKRLAEHYFPDSEQPLDNVPLIELMTALELAAEDLSQLSRQVPGGDLLNLSHWRRAVQVAGYFQKANDWYAYVSPFLNPISGLTRLGTRELIVKPAWKDMQQNVLRWFYTAYVNRLGVHFIELLSGRLAIGADTYRRLTRRSHTALDATTPRDHPLLATVVGAKGSGKTRLMESVREALSVDPALLRSRIEGMGLDPRVIDSLAAVNWVEVPSYSSNLAEESRRDRSSRQSAVKASIKSDLMVMIVDGRKGLEPGDIAFAQAWDRYFVEHPQLETPPTLVIVTNVDNPNLGTVWAPPYDWTGGQGIRESAVRAMFDSMRASLPPSFSAYVAAGLVGQTPFGVVEDVLPALAAQLHRAERTSLIRHFQSIAERSKVGRMVTQLGQQGRQMWSDLRRRRKSGSTT